MDDHKQSSEQRDSASQQGGDDTKKRSRRELIELEPEVVRIIEMATD